MAYYSCQGTTESFSFTLTESWHPTDGFLDCATGNSAVIQLARVVNELRSALLREDFSFYRIGTDTSDTVLSLVDYEANPDWNPLYDIRRILLDVWSQVITCFTPPSGIESGWYYFYTSESPHELCSVDSLVRLFDNDTLRGELLAAMVGNSFENKEDWLYIIQTIRYALENIELITEVTVLPYRTYFGYGVDSELVGTCRISPRIIYKETDINKGQNDPSAIFRTTWDPPPIQTEVRFGNGSSWANYNLWPNRASQCDGFETLIEEEPDYVNPIVRVGSIFAPGYPILTSPDGAYYAYRVPDPYCSNIDHLSGTYYGFKKGWNTFEEVRFTVRFEKQFQTDFTVTEDVKNELTGFETFWEFDVTQYVDYIPSSLGDTPVDFNITPGLSGSFVWGEGEHIKDIEFVLTLTNSNNYGVNTNFVWLQMSLFDTFQLGVDCDGDLHICLDEA